MKIEKMYLAFALLLSVIIVSSCSDDDRYNPIVLSYGQETVDFDNDHSNMYFTPFSNGTTLYIYGGDGKYTVENGNKDLLAVNYDGKALTIRPNLMEGSTAITIKDHSGNVYSLSVHVEYTTVTYSVIQQIPFVEGDNLTIKDKKALEAEIVDNMLVGSGGRYKFVFNSLNSDEGEVTLYLSKTPDTQKGTFSYERVTNESGATYTKITLLIGEKKWIYDLKPYYNPLTRSTGGGDHMVPLMFVEDVTAQYKEEFPALERAQALHAIVWATSIR